MNAEIKSTSGKSSELSKMLSFKPGVGQNIALCASPAVRNPAALIFAFSIIFVLHNFYSDLLYPNFLQRYDDTCHEG